MKIRKFIGKIYWNAELHAIISRAILDTDSNIFRLEYDANFDFPSDQANLNSSDGFNFRGSTMNDPSSINLRFYDMNGKACLVGFWNDTERHLCVVELEEVENF